MNRINNKFKLLCCGIKLLIVFVLVVSMSGVVTVFAQSVGAESTTSGMGNSSGRSSRLENSEQYIYYGTYPQTEVEETDEMKNANYDENGDFYINGQKYRRIEAEFYYALYGDGRKEKIVESYKYYKYEPIVWQVVQREDDEIVLLSKLIIDCKPFDNQEYQTIRTLGTILPCAESVTWEECTLRSWLNGYSGSENVLGENYSELNFIDTAFTQSEKDNINFTSVMGEKDKVYLMSMDEMNECFDENPSYMRKKYTEYAVGSGLTEYTSEYSDYYLMSDKDISHIDIITCSGDKSNGIVNSKLIGIVPCIRIKASAQYEGFMDNTENYVLLYSPYNSTISVPENEKKTYLSLGWYKSESEAENYTYHVKNANFDKFKIGEKFPDWKISYATERWKHMDMTSPTHNADVEQIFSDLHNLIGDLITGKQEDYINISIIYNYDVNTSSDDLFKLMENINTMWTPWGELVCLQGSVGHDSKAASLQLNLSVNGRSYDFEEHTMYFKQLNALVDEAQEKYVYQKDQLDHLCYWMGNNAEYLYKGSNSPMDIFLYKKGVCGSYANAVKEYCYLLGIPCFVVSGDVGGIGHAWNYLYVDGQWYEYDTTGASKDYLDKLKPATYGYSDTDDVKAEQLEVMKRIALKNRIFVMLDGKTLSFDQQPIVENGRTLVPLRTIFEALGAKVEWNESTNEITAVKDGKVITLQIGSDIMKINGVAKKIDVPAKVINGRTLVPIRAVSEAFGCEVTWNENSETVLINR